MGNLRGRILTGLILAATAFATTSETVDVTCPVCSHKFKAESWASTNSVGGSDRDFCRHAAGGQVFLLICWTCPGCGFTGMRESFDPEKNAATREVIEQLRKQNTLKPPIKLDPKTVHSGRIPSWVRYDLYLQVLALDEKTTPERLASACMRAGQTQRFEWNDLPEPLREAWRALEKKVELPSRDEASPYDRQVRCAFLFEEMGTSEKAKVSDAERLHARILAGVIYKMRGEDRDAMRIVESFRDAKELDPKLRAVLENIEARVGIEAKYRARAIPLFKKHLAGGKASRSDSSAIRYLIGVLESRLGRLEDARKHLVAARAAEGVPEPFKAWIDDEIAKTNGARAGRTAK